MLRNYSTTPNYYHSGVQLTSEVPMTSTPATAPDPQPDIVLAPPTAALSQPGHSADRVPALAWLVAAAFVAFELAISSRYGFMQDELYFIVASHHLAFGYVDQPPLAPLLTRITDVLGVSPTAIRIAPALAGGAVIVLTARQAALFGAGRAGRVLAALAMACAPVLLGADHSANTTPWDLLAWTVVLVCVSTALLRDRPRWWLGAGIAAGLGLEDDNIVLLLLVVLAIGILFTAQRPVLRTWWPWVGSAIALIIWAPDLIWQATHGWPQLAMSAALHRENDSSGAYAGGILSQLLDIGLLVTPLVVAGFVRLWRTAELRFLAITATLGVIYVLAWVPGKAYYSGGLAPAVLAAGAAAAESWAARGRRFTLRRVLLIAAPVVGLAAIVSFTLPIVPVSDVHKLPASSQQSSQIGDTVGWPQLTAAVAAQDAALSRSGLRPTSIFTGYYGEAAAVQVLGNHDHLPPVLSGHNAYWMWGPGSASDRTVLVVDALGQLKPYFASCRLLTTYYAPYQVQNDWTDIQIGVCTGPMASWHAIWPHLKRYE
jgi:4-amino-4-deoxy-L-arabinose transferase-like glycosyltransferase